VQSDVTALMMEMVSETLDFINPLTWLSTQETFIEKV
jgi:hypothetical protein